MLPSNGGYSYLNLTKIPVVILTKILAKIPIAFLTRILAKMR